MSTRTISLASFSINIFPTKSLSDKEEHWLLERGYDKDSIREYVNEEADDQSSSKSSAQQSLGYFIAYKDLFSTWIHMGSDFSVDNVRTGLSSFNRLISESHKKVFLKASSIHWKQDCQNWERTQNLRQRLSVTSFS